MTDLNYECPSARPFYNNGKSTHSLPHNHVPDNFRFTISGMLIYIGYYEIVVFDANLNAVALYPRKKSAMCGYVIENRKEGEYNNILKEPTTLSDLESSMEEEFLYMAAFCSELEYDKDELPKNYFLDNYALIELVSPFIKLYAN